MTFLDTGKTKAALADRKTLLAEAARESFANVRFQPPTDTPRHAGEPTLAYPPGRSTS